MRIKHFVFSILILFLTISACDTSDVGGDVLHNITESEAWLSEANAWEIERLAWVQNSVSFDTLSKQIMLSGSNHEGWNYITQFASNVDEAVTWSVSLSSASKDSAEVASQKMNDALEYSEVGCSVNANLRYQHVHNKMTNSSFRSQIDESLSWIPMSDSIRAKWKRSEEAWAFASQDWFALWKLHRLSGSINTNITC